MEAKWWPVHAAHFDPRLSGLPDYEERLRNTPDWLQAEIQMPVMERKFTACTAAIAKLADALRSSAVDAVVVIGDDQNEMFTADSVPALAIFTGERLVDYPSDVTTLPPSFQVAEWARHSLERTAWPGYPDLAVELTYSLTEQGFDVCQIAQQAEGRTLGHAFTFVFLRLLREAVALPMVPVLLNTYYPPNQPRAARCWSLGGAIRKAIDAWKADARIAIIASGGLSHFIVDTALDELVLEALQENDGERLGAIPESALQSGSSEIKNWIVAGAALEGLKMDVVDYIAAYRTGAGTGIGLAFATWRP